VRTRFFTHSNVLNEVNKVINKFTIERFHPKWSWTKKKNSFRLSIRQEDIGIFDLNFYIIELRSKFCLSLKSRSIRRRTIMGILRLLSVASRRSWSSGSSTGEVRLFFIEINIIVFFSIAVINFNIRFYFISGLWICH